jgi:DNA-binding LacI/PurR family transcriptional regulator
MNPSSQRQKPVTLRDIAKTANVSYQTVSLVINDKPGVSAETRRRILKLVQELRYQPNAAARMLSTSRSKMLELLLVDAHYGGRLAGTMKNMATAAELHGYSFLISETTADSLADAVARARARLVEGVVLYAPRLVIDDDALLALFGDLPLVRRDFVPDSKLPWVGFDQTHAMRLAVEHLIGLGHTQIATIAPETGILNGYWREHAWRAVLLEHGLEPGPIAWGDYSMQSGYTAAQQLLASGRPFTAAVIGTDNMAVGAMRALREQGLSVPADVSLVSFDNTELAAYLEPPLTTVSFPFGQQDDVAVSYLLELLAAPATSHHQRVLNSELIVRGSTAEPHQKPTRQEQP